MWKYLEKYENGDVTVDQKLSFYVGDAAGRIGTEVSNSFQKRHPNIGQCSFY